MNTVFKKWRFYYIMLRLICFALLVVFELVNYTKGKEIKLIMAGVFGVIAIFESVELFAFINKNKYPLKQEESFDS